ncbi:MAG: type II toxin-antitoxin system RelB/DinJ family antitoxin [Peptococcaceae bacterium]|jgi:DNA-damage-inducible protein J|nr:type II toxin-antitoxin system RelB/DinJ family antitoxin [Peptococcaceae bacterium]
MANVNIRVDDTLKHRAESIFSELGLSMSAATNVFYKQVVRCGGIPFQLKTELNHALAEKSLDFDAPKPLPKIKRNELNAMMEGSVAMSLLGALPHSKLNLDEIRAERLARHERTH